MWMYSHQTRRKSWHLVVFDRIKLCISVKRRKLITNNTTAIQLFELWLFNMCGQMCGLAFRLKKCKNNLKNNWSSSVLSLLFNKWFNRFHWGACFLLNQVVQCWFYTDRDDSHHCGKANPEVKGRCVQTACDILLLFRRCDGHKVSSVSDTVAASRHPALPDACPSLIAVWAEGLPAVRRVADRSWVRWREREDNMSHTHTFVCQY